MTSQDKKRKKAEETQIPLLVSWLLTSDPSKQCLAIGLIAQNPAARTHRAGLRESRGGMVGARTIRRNNGGRLLAAQARLGLALLVFLLVLAVTARVFSAARADEADRDLDDHHEPEQVQHQQRQQEGQEDPLHGPIHADGPVDVEVRRKQVREPVRVPIGRQHLGRRARVAPVGHDIGHVLVDRPA